MAARETAEMDVEPVVAIAVIDDHLAGYVGCRTEIAEEVEPHHDRIAPSPSQAHLGGKPDTEDRFGTGRSHRVILPVVEAEIKIGIPQELLARGIRHQPQPCGHRRNRHS